MNKFYTYAYLDKNIKKKSQYSKTLKFDYLPRYVGKGTGRRASLIEEHKKHNVGLSFMNTADIEIVFIDKNLTDEQAREKEIEYISLIGRLDLEDGPLFNKTDGGDGISGYKHTKAAKKHHSETLTGHMGWSKGLTKETDIRVKQISESNTGKHRSNETKRKMSEARIGNKCYWYGRKGEDCYTSKEYIIITAADEFVNIKGLRHYCRENKDNINHSSICKTVNGKRKHHKGYRAFHVPG